MINIIICSTVSFLVGFLIYWLYVRIKLGGLKNHIRDMLENARKEGDSIKKERILEAKDEALRIKQNAEEEYKQKLKDVREAEKEILKKESNLERRSDFLDQRYDNIQKQEDELRKKEKKLEEKVEEIENLIRQQQTKLEEIGGLSADEAKEILMNSMIEKAQRDAQVKVKEIREQALLNANKEAKKIIIEAIQRSAADHTAETTVTVVNLPNEQMKGRVIGREGRNIRHFESLTGVELIVDDTPEAVVLSGFDPIRRETARIALEKLIQDGRIHPARIEEMIEKATKEIEESI
ncbi:MAG: Ribonuclease Y, partial [Marinimicrobia bacterium 46_47]